jgi:hypothetical protein
MNDNSSTKEYNVSVGKDNLPRITLFVKTLWYKILMLSGLWAAIWITINIYLVKNRNVDIEFYNFAIFWTNIILGPIVFIILIIGLIQRKGIKVFKINAKQNILIYESYWSSVKVNHKEFSLEDIDRFDVFRRVENQGKYKRVGWKCLCLSFRSKSPVCFTILKEESNTIEFAQVLNEFLASNTNLNKERLREEITLDLLKGYNKRIIVIIRCIEVIFIILFFIVFTLWLIIVLQRCE